MGLFVEFTARALFLAGENTAEEVEERVPELSERTHLTLTVILYGCFIALGCGSFFALCLTASVAFAVNPVVSECFALGCLTYRTSLGSVAICGYPSVLCSTDRLSFIYNRVAICATSLSGVSV